MSEPSSQTNRHSYRSAAVVGVYTLLSRVLGAVRDLALTHIFGASDILDAFFQAFTIPNVFRRLTAEGSMTLVFIPLYTEVRSQLGPEAAKVFAQKVLTVVLLSTMILTALGILFSPQLVYLFSAGFADDPEKYARTIFLTRLMFPYLIFVSLVAWAMGVLNSEKEFATPAAAPIFLNLAMIVAAVGLTSWMKQPIIAVAWGVLIGGMIQVGLQIPALLKIKQSLRPLSPLGDPHIRRLLILLVPSLLGVAVYQLNMIVLRNLASFLPSGQITYYYTASRLTELAIGIFAFAITTTSFPTLSEETAAQNWDKAAQTLKFSLLSTLLIVLPATAGLMGYAKPVVAMMYLHGAYTFADVIGTAKTLMGFALGIPAIAAIRLIVSIFYALQDTKTPVWISIINIAITAALGWWWSHVYGVVGLAYALSAGIWIQLLCLVVALISLKKFSSAWIAWLPIGRYTLVSFLMGSLVFMLGKLSDWKSGPFSLLNWGLFLSTLTFGMIFYFFCLWLLKDEQALQLIQWMGSALKKKR